MHVALVYPPSCDPTAPYLSLPTLAAWLRAHDVRVTLVDANLEGWLHVLDPARLATLGKRVETRLTALERKGSLSHEEQLLYAQLWRARGDAADAPDAIGDALAVFRDGARFYDPAAYATAVNTVDSALRVVSAAHAPLALDFVAYRTPFSLLNGAEIARDAARDRDPFHAYFVELADRLARERVDLVGLSVAFPGQMQPAFALAYALRARMPSVHVTIGGPALTQMLLRLDDEARERALGPFSSAVVFEGEHALLDMVRALERGEDPAASGRVLRGRTVDDLRALPSPDFTGLPLERYLAPELVLPYDPTRGCYWGACTFCHYGLSEVGTAKYRERSVGAVLDHLAALRDAHRARVFYFSQDVFSPRIAADVARGIKARDLGVRWGTDMRPERSLTAERCAELAAGGALSVALGVESASERVLTLIDKGLRVDDVRHAVQNLSKAGIAVEAMCFTDFPTETHRDAMATVRFVRTLTRDLALFIVGRFDLTPGSLVARTPGEYGIEETWNVDGDELKTGLFFAEGRPSKTDAQQEKLEAEVAEVSRAWHLRRYPWAGALSTAHTMLYYAHFGKDVFRRLAPLPEARLRPTRERVAEARFDVEQIEAASAEREASIWGALVHERRAVSVAAYRELAACAPRARPAPGKWRYAPGGELERVERARRTDRDAAGDGDGDKAGKAKPGRTAAGRRPSHAGNSMKRG